jgi:hypothetical protein
MFSPPGKLKMFVYIVRNVTFLWLWGGGGENMDHMVSQTEFCWGGGAVKQSSSKPIKARHVVSLLIHINHWIWVLLCMSMCTSVGKWSWTKLFTRYLLQDKLGIWQNLTRFKPDNSNTCLHLHPYHTYEVAYNVSWLEPTKYLNIFCCPTRGLMKAVDFSEHLVQIYQSTRCPIPQKSNIQPPGEPKI